VEIKKELNSLKNPAKAAILQRFFKTGKGEYGEGDIFLGITVPEQRKVAARYKDLPLKKIKELLESNIHEHRLTGLMILVFKFKKAKEEEKKEIFDFYLNHTGRINNWDLVDLSSPNIVGEWLLFKDKDIIYKLAFSANFWERRIAAVSTLRFIKENSLDDTFAVAELLLKDEHDLIHKAVGWMLREAGKKDQKKLEAFLDKNSQKMPRTMLRYAIEKFTEEKRKHYLGK
jgi:3-methyladenine DNA glycosylase AlkD